MPIPFIILGGLGAIAASGAAATGHGIYKSAKAKKINEEAEELYEKEVARLENIRELSSDSLEQLGRTKIAVLDKSVTRFIAAFEKIHNVDIEDSVGLRELSKFRMNNQSFQEFRELSSAAATLLGSAVAGVTGGSLAAFGAFSAAMTFGTASTGTAIAGLSGAAATNATLAALGGGSLAAGGMGIAGGTAVLGGIVAAPALAVMGFIVSKKGSANLDKAYSNFAEAEELAEELKTATALCKGIAKRSMMFTKLLKNLDSIFKPLITRLEQIVAGEGINYQGYSNESKKTVAMAMAVAGAVKKTIDTPILSVDGEISLESEVTAKEISGFLESHKA